MALDANAYGTTPKVASRTPRHASGQGDQRDFTESTKPTKTQVENFLNEISALVNGFMAQEGFTTFPITDANALRILEGFVMEEVAAIIEGINGSGRYGPSRPDIGRTRHSIMMAHAKKFVKENALGIEYLGVSRSKPNAGQILYRDTDEAGDATFPLIQRKQFKPGFKDADT